jgi:hypothetical protein
MDTGKATWDGCGTDHGSLASVHGANHFNVGMYHVWHQHSHGTNRFKLLYKIET